ncbi:hypothetical protein [Paenibacillus sp. 1P07SE]|uniref:hypothetical protein n=1 Tax=Paenibacillus sp. 1P07SE TaxID=3132209 RepID=UPI0039A41E0E
MITLEQLNPKKSEQLQSMEEQLRGMQGELLQAAANYLVVSDKLQLVEEKTVRNTEELRELMSLANDLQKQYDRFGEKIDKLENKLFSWMQQMQRDNAELIKAAQTEGALERQTTLKSWMTFLQYVLGGTIFIIVAYVFGVNFIQ